MQFRRLDSFGDVAPVEAAAGHALPSPPASMDPSDHLNPIREEALQLLKPNRDWTRATWIAGIALLAGFGLGWAGSSSWNSSPTAVASVVQKESGSRRAEARPSTKADATRKQATPGAGSHNSPRPSFMTRSDEAPRTTAALPSNLSLPAAPVTAREAVVAAPETRPATVEGWTVREVRGGTVVLEGPDGIRTASAGDTVPGVGRIDSIVRWGNHWIVATAIGLIASP